MNRVFLLSPANAGGERARLLLRPAAAFELAVRLRSREGASLGEIYSFASGLYFRGKLAYAQAFGRAAPGVPGSLVIVPGFGFIEPERRVRATQLKTFGKVPIDLQNREYRAGLEEAARSLNDRLGPTDEIVLLGSIASTKYTAVLLEVFGSRLMFPIEFVGRGDMSRGGLLLRCAQAKTELQYQSVLTSILHGPRPPRLPPKSSPLPLAGGG